MAGPKWVAEEGGSYSHYVGPLEKDKYFWSVYFDALYAQD